jgi:tetrahydromethanopterin S-methyltransferase subunit G
MLQTKSYATIMAVMVPREELTEHRLDALEKKVDDGFAEVKSEMRSRFDRIDDRFDRVQQTLIAGFAVIVAALIGSIATLIGVAFF